MRNRAPRWERWTQRLRKRRRVPVWYHEAYRLPVPVLHQALGIDMRRADEVSTYLLDDRVIDASDLRQPHAIGYDALALVHSERLLTSLQDASALGRILGVEPQDLRPSDVLHAVRLACGGTLGAAQEVLKNGGTSLNLLGGFHHASPTRASGLCLVNDIAVAVASLRRNGFAGRVVVLDFDAHPPDGTAACFHDDDRVWIGSISGADWGPLPQVDETVLKGADEDRYLAELQNLLDRMPNAELAFVIAGGDVLRGDRLGDLGLRLDAARERDRHVANALRRTPSVWLPGGGYHPDAWKLLAGTALMLSERSDRPIAPSDPLHLRFARVAQSLAPEDLGASLRLTEDDIHADLGMTPAEPRLLGYYTREGLAHAISRYGVSEELRRRGFHHLRVDIDRHEGRDRVRVFARRDESDEVEVMEALVELTTLSERKVLYIEWLTLRDPTRALAPDRRPLPGQDHPGLGLAREVRELFIQMATRLGLHGVAFRPAWFHTAHAARHHCRFVDDERHARFKALIHDTSGLSQQAVSEALEDGRVTLNGAPYMWEAEVMVHWIDDASVATPSEATRADDWHFVVRRPCES